MAFLGVLKALFRNGVSRAAGQKSLDVLLAGSVVWWGAGALRRMDHGALTPIGGSVAFLHAVVAGAFVIRCAPSARPQRSGLLWALPSLVASGLASWLAGSPAYWPQPAAALFIGGAMLTAVAICGLGRSFAVLPQARPLVTGGPYGVIRHPMYLGELLVMLACCLASPDWRTATVFAIAVPAIVVRALAEEGRLHAADPQGFQSYCASVRWRLLPGAW